MLKLREMLAGVLTAIHHIGSTAVPNQRLIFVLEIESLAALDGVNDKMHDMRSTPRGDRKSVV